MSDFLTIFTMHLASLYHYKNDCFVLYMYIDVLAVILFIIFINIFFKYLYVVCVLEKSFNPQCCYDRCRYISFFYKMTRLLND